MDKRLCVCLHLLNILTREFSTNCWISALETAIAYWDLLLAPVYGAKVGIWCDFLNELWKRAISRDTWNMFYVFLQDWDKDPELKLYDEEAAWPSLIDEFVEHVHDDLNKSKDWRRLQAEMWDAGYTLEG